MKFEPGKKYNIFARVDHVNRNNKYINLTVTLSDLSIDNLKVNEEQFNNITIGNVYNMNIECTNNGTRNQNSVVSFELALNMKFSKELEAALRVFYTCTTQSIFELKKRIESYLNSINNKVIKDITFDLYKKYENKFAVYPAATKFHHAYIGGLLFHTVSMLDLCDKYVEIYPSLDRNYLISGVILHDIMKIEEFESPVSSDYSLEGQLVGHLVMGAIEIDKIASKFKYSDKEEVLILKHILISHHGQLAFGSPKKPMTKEALLIWYLDSIDSKLRVLEEEIEKVDEGTFTNNIMVLERSRFYKTKKEDN